jgi:hypothetical protein
MWMTFNKKENTMQLTEAQILDHMQAFVDEVFNSADGWQSIQEQDDAYYWEGIKLAIEEKPRELCWHHKQREGYDAMVADERYDS